MMNIVNQTKFDESLMKRFARFWSSLFKKHRFLNWIYYGIALLLVVLIVVMSVVNLGDKGGHRLVFYLRTLSSADSVLGYLAHFLPEKACKSLSISRNFGCGIYVS